MITQNQFDSGDLEIDSCAVMDINSLLRNTSTLPRCPRVSVVIPTRQEARHIAKTLDAILVQDSDECDEIIVVDGNSTDGTQEVVESYRERDPRIRLFGNPKKIVPAAMNIGIREATGDIIVRVDGHCSIASNYIRSVLTAFRESGAHCVGGAMVAQAEGWQGRIIAVVTSSSFGVGGSRFHKRGQAKNMDTVYLGAYPTQLLRALGGYDERFVRNQDDELNYRLRSLGGRVYYCPDIWASYDCRSSFRKLASQYFQYGWWKVRVYQKHPLQLKLRHLAPAGLVLAALSLMLASAVSVSFSITASVVLAALYTTAAITSALRDRASKWDLPLLVLAYATLHFSYGAGFCLGLLTVPFALRYFPIGRERHG